MFKQIQTDSKPLRKASEPTSFSKRSCVIRHAAADSFIPAHPVFDIATFGSFPAHLNWTCAGTGSFVRIS